ncbi:hypothetical protein AAFF_G00308590 [Aldrovandia affinis]|uniref:OCA domain-containing protein n=1 Tax=Aldrovandia affinis TaxID=143900 RepID=A0AAD7WQS0_9TELE|nr:hypothetical protein AAFF_G00308590 [Aldrovandia affinis]
MIVDRYITEEFAGVADPEAGVMTSPLNLYSFYGNSPPGYDPPCFSGDVYPWSPSSDSDSGKTWNSAPSPTQASNYHNSGEPFMDSLRQPRYQGVRVKNPVKELILQKRCSPASWQSSHENKQVFGDSETEHCPALTAALLGVKRPADHAPSGLSCPKRPTPIYNSMPQSPCSLGGGGSAVKEDGSGCETHLDFADIILQIRECAPISIATVKVQETTSQAAPLCPNFLPEVMAFTSIQPYPHPGPLSAHPAPVLQPSHTAPRGMSFFQWQVEQEEEKLAGLTPDQLAARDEDGDTFLHVAVAQGRRALSYVLARRMAQLGLLDLKEHNGQTALQVSIAANQHLIVQDLLILGAQINTTDCWGRSPLHVCAEKGHAQTLQAVHKTLKSTTQQLNVEAVNYEGLTALHVAVLSHNAVVQELGGVAPPHSAWTQALLQRRKALGESVSTLLLMGASYRTMDHKSGRTSLHMVAEEANVELLRLFLDQPDSLAAVNTKAYNGNTALHMVSALQGRVAQLDAVKLLMRHGADPSIKNLEHEQPTQLAPEGPAGDQVRRILKGRGGQTRPI